MGSGKAVVTWYDADKDVQTVSQYPTVMLHARNVLIMKAIRARFIAITIINSKEYLEFIVKEEYGPSKMGQPLQPAVNI